MNPFHSVTIVKAVPVNGHSCAFGPGPFCETACALASPSGGPTRFPFLILGAPAGFHAFRKVPFQTSTPGSHLCCPKAAKLRNGLVHFLQHNKPDGGESAFPLSPPLQPIGNPACCMALEKKALSAQRGAALPSFRETFSRTPVFESTET